MEALHFSRGQDTSWHMHTNHGCVVVQAIAQRCSVVANRWMQILTPLCGWSESTSHGDRDYASSLSEFADITLSIMLLHCPNHALN